MYDLAMMEPYPLTQLYTAFSKGCDSVVLYLPRTSDLTQLAEQYKAKRDGEKLKTIHYCMQGASKALCVFYGEFAMD